MFLVKSKIDLEAESYTEADKRMDELLEKYYDKHYDSFEEFQKDVYEHIDRALKQVEQGNYLPMEVVLSQWREKYGIRC